jgi:hypothetical protein
VSLEQRAFVFDFRSFSSELAPLLDEAIGTGSVEALRAFIAAHVAELRDPNEGDKLDEAWESRMETRDPHQYGDVALTKYYSPTLDIGLGSKWSEVDDELRALNPDLGDVLLGRTIGPSDSPFDPGKMGAYFQSPELVAENIVRLNSVAGSSAVAASRRLLEHAASEGKGLYVTF